MQLPFVLQSAEVMKAAVAYLEPHMEATDEDGKGRIVIATVKGDVHDIGKNLVDIILSNNGYDVVNLGIKQPIATILDAAIEQKADVIGMSGLLVKSTVVMKDNLQELNAKGVAEKFPVLLGGAALTRSYVENDLAEVYEATSATRATHSRACTGWTRSWPSNAAADPTRTAGSDRRPGEGGRAQGAPRTVQADRGEA